MEDDESDWAVLILDCEFVLWNDSKIAGGVHVLFHLNIYSNIL